MAKRNLHYRKKIILLFALCFFVSHHLLAVVKEVGVPVVQNFKRIDYNAGTQNWSVDQGSNGVMYFGNNHGLLRYDGQFWNTYRVPNGSNIRVVHYSEIDEVLYVGAYNDLGYFTNDSIGATRYISLKELVPPKFQDFGDVWKVLEGPWGIAFQTFDVIFFYKDKKMTIVEPRSSFHYSYLVNGTFYIFDRENGLLEYRNGFLKKIPGGDFFIHKEVWSILPLNNDEELIGTASEGMFIYDGISMKPWDTPVNELLKKYQIYSSLVVDDEHYAFGTIQNGLIICDRQGNIKQIINREKGLQNNTILSMSTDLDGNLWLGLDNGIDYVEINSPITLLQDFYDFGTGYTSITHKDKLYLGSNQGLFYCLLEDFYSPTLSASDFHRVENTSGQVWSLKIIEDRLYCGHNNGSFLIQDTVGIQINEIPGCWAFNELPGSSGTYLEGTYSGIHLWKLEGGQLKYINPVKGINYSSQEVACMPNNIIWVSHAFNGVKQYKLNEELDSLILIKQYTVSDGLPSNFLNKVKAMSNGQLLLTTPEGVYQYSADNDNFYKSGYYNNLFQNKPIQYIQEDDNRNIWYVGSNNEGGVLRYLEDGTYTNVSYPFNKLKGKFIGSFFHFNIIDDSNVLIALEKGFAHYNPKMLIDYRRGFNAVLNSVSLLTTGKVLYNGVWFNNSTNVDIHPVINYKDNSLRFTFTGLFFEGLRENKFSFYLEGFDNDWSEWQFESTKEYTNLPDGEFTFRVRVKNKYGVIAMPKPFSFTISPPFYKSLQAIIIYFVLFLIFTWFWINLFLKRVERTRIKEKEIQRKRYLEREEQLKRDALEAEKEIIRLRNEKLRAEMIHKDKELANSAMNLVQKNKQFNKIKAELKKIQSDLKEELLKSRINMIIRKIDKETSNDESWSVFETNFEQVHEDFLKRLREKHPDITPKELKLSAYLRMNISSKEIATLMNITTRGVEISRYRLRKKFDLDRSQNLIDYILSI